ncbi:MAG: DeoR family transcriptional regulator [Chitinivibrionales bacterium]|nr:DeoR family transcriptional regulator [Chitinivibrionales bacterium]
MSDERRNRIFRYISEKGFATADELSERLGASAVTIRRDFQRLEDARLIERVHGGARLTESATFDTPYSWRRSQQVEAKRAIGEYAVTLLRSGQALLLDAGSTCVAAAAAIPDDLHIRVVTHSVEALHVLHDKPNVEVVAIGGQLNRDLGSCVGPITEELLGRFHADVSFLGAAHVNAEQGLVNDHLAESTIKRLIHQNATACYLLVDHTKLGARGFQTTVPMRDFQGTIVTDSGVDTAQEQRLRERGVRVVVAGRDG